MVVQPGNGTRLGHPLLTATRRFRRLAVALAASLVAALQAVGATPPPLFVEALVEPTSVYEGQQARVVVRLFRQRDAPSGQLEELRLGELAEVSRLGQIRVFETDRDGARYRVLERRYAVRPLASGPLTLPALRFRPRVADAQQFSAPATATAQAAVGGAAPPASGPVLTLDVRARPRSAADPWLPALAVSATETWSADPGTMRVGDALTRTITVRARGVTGSGLPTVSMRAEPALDLHHDRPATRTHFHADGVRGQREQRIVVIATRPGTVQMPAWQLRWWDVTADAERTITLPARTIEVLAGAAGRTDGTAEQVPSAAAHGSARIAGLVAVLGAGVAAWAWWRRGRGLRRVRRRLRRACRAGNALDARTALVEWANLAGPQTAHDLQDVAARLQSGEARAAVAELTTVLYGRRGVLAGAHAARSEVPGQQASETHAEGPAGALPYSAQAWCGRALWAACRRQLKGPGTAPARLQAGPPLPQLHPLAAGSRAQA